MKNYFTVGLLALVPLFLHSQDTIQKRTGETIVATVLEISQDEIMFHYPEEILVNRLPINALKEIIFESGRVQKFEALNDHGSPFPFEAPEPRYAGDILAINEKGEMITDLERQKSSIKSNANAMLLVTGIGKAKTRNMVDGASSPVRLESGKILLVAKVNDNNRDPERIFNLFKLEVKKDKRMVMIASANTFGTSKAYDIDFLDFVAHQYGKDSFILELEILEPGEYAITSDTDRNMFLMFGVD